MLALTRRRSRDRQEECWLVYYGVVHVAACKLVEIANAAEAVQDGRVYIENGPSSKRAVRRTVPRRARAITLGWLWRHESGTSVRFTPAGAEMFA